jgi:tetratricopeptide (TPR) repeat protein
MKKSFALISFVFLLHSAAISQGKKPFELELYFNRTLTDSDRVVIKQTIYNYSQQIAANPDQAPLYINRGVQYAFLGLYPDAISDYTKAIKIDSTLAEAYYNRGIAKSRFNYTKGACLDVKKSALLGLSQGKVLYEKKCGLFKPELGELP